MPTRERVAAFIRLVESGDHVKAIEDYYHADASMRENSRPPRSGRDALVAYEASVLERRKLKAVDTHPAHAVLIDGDNVAIHWTFDFVDPQGGRLRLTEVALQRWRGDRVAEERFFYDPTSILPPA
jgi:ketosteroid isomerase-like protein